MKKSTAFFNYIYKTLQIVLIFIMAIVAISAIPLPGNYRLYSVQSGSMEPVLKTGGLIFVKSFSNYQTNDIITVKTDNPKNTVTHRVVTINNQDNQISYEIKGDANQTKDIQPVKHENVVGKVIFHLPFLGYPISYSKTLPGLIFLIIIPTVIIISSEVQSIKTEVIRLFKKKKLTKHNQGDD